MRSLRSLVRPSLCSLWVGLLASTPLAQGSVHVYDASNGPGTDFTSIESALAAAAPGDTILCRSTCSPVITKPVTLMAEGPEREFLTGLRVQDLGPGENVALRGFSLRSPTFSNVINCQGTVWIEDFDVEVAIGSHGWQYLGLSIHDSSSVVLVDATFNIQETFALNQPLLIRNSNVSLHNCSSRGEVYELTERTITPALEIHGGTVRLAGSSLTGGPSGGFDLFCDGIDGGPAVILRDGAEVIELDSQVSGGAGSTSGGCPPGQRGQAYDLEPGCTVDVIDAQSRSFKFPAHSYENNSATAEIRGVENDFVWLVYAADPILGPVGVNYDGWLTMLPPYFDAFLGTVPTSGVLQRTFNYGPLPPGVDVMRLHIQTVHWSPTVRRFTLSSPSVQHLLDGRF